MMKLGLVTRLIENIPPYPELRDLILENKHKGPSLCIFDDSRESFANLESLYTIGSHHLNCSCITLSQTLFDEGK